ncbi:reverse transcriptase domain-containing protein [Tanacetum coccineum]|uniref:Reverse transcriptase domain-containing protein n=1 Tax=Tanacetum coccineum TaxID=301880 RepID=A0ABQ5A799_9ASTR
MKPLPKHLEYAYLEKDSLLPVVISALLKDDEKKRLVSVLKKHKEAFAWKTSDIPGISLSFCKHKINFEDDAKAVIQRQQFDIETKNKKRAENSPAYHLSRLENPNLRELRDDDIDDNLPDETLMNVSSNDEEQIPWFADFANYLGDTMVLPPQKIKFLTLVSIGQQFSIQNCDACQHSSSLARRDKMPQNSIQVSEIFDIWRINFVGPFPKSHKFEYILVAIDYVSKWVVAEALPTNDARVVINFLKKLFSRYGIPKALMSDKGTHFRNKQMEKVLKRYGVHHHFATTYHLQTSGHVKNTNRALKRILEKIVKDNPSVWSRKLENAMWAFRTAYKTPIGTTPYRLLYGKTCHLPFKIKHRAFWALRSCNPDLKIIGEK